MLMPAYPVSPSPQDWQQAAASMWRGVPSPFPEPDGTRKEGPPPTYADPLGALVARARDRMRTRHANTPAYLAFLEHCAAERRAKEEASEAARQRRDQAKTAKQRAEEQAHYDDGGTAEEWEALQLEKAEATKVKAIRRTAMSPRRKRSTAEA
jgi:hypothetical protein